MGLHIAEDTSEGLAKVLHRVLSVVTRARGGGPLCGRRHGGLAAEEGAFLLLCRLLGRLTAVVHRPPRSAGTAEATHAARLGGCMTEEEIGL